MINDKYTATIGIETHVQLKTRTKLFAAVELGKSDQPPNTLISQICLGMPGALPVLNEKAVALAAKAANALNTKAQAFSKFDRKHYFYPDLPKGYQITQYDQPIILGGFVEFKIGNDIKRVRITRAHLEEDAGKTLHPSGQEYSLVDLNRAGAPLLEIVSEPDMHTAEEARAYAHELYLLMRYADVSDADLYQGNMRFDVNVSVSSDPTKMGTRTETKNLNSFKSVEKAVEYEIKRQIELIEKGEGIVQETLGWDDAKQKTFSQRSKEEAYDYRYFPEPDIPPLDLSEEWLNAAVGEVSTLPAQLREKLLVLQLSNSSVETLVDEIPAGNFIEKILEQTDNENAKRIANWLTTDIQGGVNAGELSWGNLKIETGPIIELATSVKEGKINNNSARTVLIEYVKTGENPMGIAERMQLLQNTDNTFVENLVNQVIDENSKAVEDYKAGEEKSLGFLVGQVMRLSKGQASPQIVNQLIKDKLK